jgi:putative oxidoreductase
MHWVHFRRQLARYSTVFFRLALAAGFFTSVTDRFGIWGPYGVKNVAWGDMSHFLEYTATLNPYLPTSAIPPLGWLVTGLEVGLGLALVLGVRTRAAAVASGFLLLAFGLGMTIGTGVKSALNASVFAASAGALLLGSMDEYPWSVDALLAARK